MTTPHSLTTNSMELLLAGLFLCALFKYAALLTLEKAGKRRVKVGTVTGINIYPVKTLSGIEIQEARCTTLGLKWRNIRDRHWMVTSSDYTFISQREEPTLVLVKCQVTEDCLLLKAPTMQALELPLNPRYQSSSLVVANVFEEPIPAVDCGEAASRWVETFLGKSGFRIVFAAPGLEKRHLTDSTKPFINQADPSAEVAFANSSPFLLGNEASLRELNGRLENKVTMKNFRPNIIISAETPFEEDNWEEVFINDVKLKKVKLCERCPQVTVDTETGIKDKQFQPLKTLRTYRIPPGYQKACFGVSMAVEQEGDVQVGDQVYAVMVK